MNKILSIFFSSCLAILTILPNAHAEEPNISNEEKLPLYEYGLAALGARIPHYTGSDQYQTYAFPVPYFVYRGEVFKADRDGLRGIFWHSRKFELDISLAGNPPAEDDRARTGMDSLGAIVEVGPALNYYFYNLGERDSFFLQLALRGAISLDFDSGLDIGYQGYASDVTLIFRNSKLLKEEKIRFHASTGIRVANAQLNGYFYDVSPAQATAERAAYDSDGGYAGFQVSGSITKEITHTISISGYGKWLNIDGAVFEDSSLVMTKNNYIVGAMLVWTIGESEELVK